MTVNTRNISLVRRLYEEALNQARYVEVVGEIVAGDVVTHNASGEDSAHREHVTNTMRALHTAFSDLVFTIDDMIEQGDRIAVRWHMTGRHTGPFAGRPPSGRTVTQRAIVIYRIAEHKVVEVWPLTDRFGLVQQLEDAPLSPHTAASGGKELTASPVVAL